jgi:hypothetical protein
MSDNQMTTRIQNYLGGKFDDAQLEQFECEMLSNPALAYEVGVAQLMQSGAVESRTTNNVVEISSTRKIVPSSLRRSTWLPWTLTAAATITAVGLGLQTAQLQRSSKQLRAQIVALNAPSSEVGVQMLQVYRDASASATVVPSVRTRPWLLLIPVSQLSSHGFDVQLLAKNGSLALQLNGVQASAESLLSIYLPKNSVPVGEYTLRVKRVDGDHTNDNTDLPLELR